jgi:hypothetical protein
MCISGCSDNQPKDPLLSDKKVATAGYFQLSWKKYFEKLWPKRMAEFQLQESLSKDFHSYRTIYQGPDYASVLSGKSNGVFYYRVVANSGKTTLTTNIVKVTVSHHSLYQAFAFFSAGAIVFFILLVMILRGVKQGS